MTLSLVSLMAANVDEAAADLAAHLTAAGIDTQFASGPHSERLELVSTERADVLWLCGWQALTMADDSMELVAAPSFVGEAPGTYRSYFVSRFPVDGLDGLLTDDVVWAMNEPGSWSGYRVVRAECDLRGLSFPSRIVWSGSHFESIRMLAEGAADAAAIDSTVWGWAGAEALTIADVTRPWPAPPIVIRSDLRREVPHLVDLIVGGARLRSVDGLRSADRRHLEPMRAWLES